jgi:hypothetical protein
VAIWPWGFKSPRPHQKRNEMKKRMIPSKDRKKVEITLVLPEDVIEELDYIAKRLDMKNHKSVIRYYIGQGMLRDAHIVCDFEKEQENETVAKDKGSI